MVNESLYDSHEVLLYPQQKEFISCKGRLVSFIGGIGCGKTHALAVWVVRMIAQYPNSTGLLAAKTHDQLVTATMPPIIELLHQFKIPFFFGRRQGALVLVIENRQMIYCRSLKNSQNLRGITIDWAGLDELAFSTEESLKIVLGRLRGKNGPHEIRVSTSPNGFNWFYDLAIKNLMIRASAYDNPFLPKGYIEFLEKNYDPKLFKQEVLGEFIDITSGGVYYNFSERNIRETTYKNGTVLFGTDFNVDPITAVLGYYDGHILHIVDEIYIRNSNTFELADEMDLKAKDKIVKVYPDATGAARKTSALRSDHNILRTKKFKVIARKSNPLVKDRYNAVNLALFKERLIIHPRCKNLINDLRKMSYENKDPLLSHISDALGYLVWNIMPIIIPRANKPVVRSVDILY